MMILLICLSLLLSIFNFNADRSIRNKLSDIASFIEERPDSALVALREMPSASSKSVLAKQALLHSMALDKCYIDLVNDSIIAPAVSFYSHHGNPDDRLKMYYYKARIFENAGDSESALMWLVKGERYAPKCEDLSAVGRLYTSKGTLYYSSYHLTDAITNDNRALYYYSLSGDKSRQIMAKLDLAISNICLHNNVAVDSLLLSLNDDRPYMNLQQRARYCRINLILAIDTTREVKKALNMVYEDIPYPDAYPPLEMARAYNFLNEPDSSEFYLTKYQNSNKNKTYDNAYFFALSGAKALNGDYKAAYVIERNYIANEMNDLYGRLQSEINYVEERTRTEYETRLAKERSTLIFLLLLILFLSAAAVAYILSLQLKRKKEETRMLKARYDSILEEKTVLEQLSKGSSVMSEGMKNLLSERIEAIEKVLVMRKANSHVSKDIAMARLDDLIGSKKSFLVTLSLLYAVCHQDFMKHLKECQLTDTEIGYCCLYGLGLNIKEVEDLLDTKRVYTTNSEIRKKLKIQDQDCTLPEYLNSLL